MKFALVCGCDYNGSWKVYQSYNDSKKFYSLLINYFNFKKENIHTLFNSQYTHDNIIKELKWLASKLNNDDSIGVIYVAGHGTQVNDANGDELDGRDEAWQTFDRKIIIDDIITKIMSTSHPKSHLTIISDCCHSGTMLDFIDRDQCNNKFSDRNWVSIGSALDYQSAIQSGNGSVCTFFLLKIIKQNKNITIKELKNLLENEMKYSFIGNMQKSLVLVSNDTLWEQTIFS